MKNDSARIFLTFDDAVRSQAEFVAPLLLELGLAGTFYITEFEGEGTDRFETDKVQYMDWRQIKDLHRLGFEVGNHGLTHEQLHRISGTRLLEEIEGIEKRCAGQGLPLPLTFCYPVGQGNNEAIPIFQRKGYRCARAVGDRFYEPGKDSVWEVPSFVLQDSNTERFGEILEALREGPEDRVAVFTFHGVPDRNHPWVTLEPERFREMMSAVVKSGLRCGLMRDLPV